MKSHVVFVCQWFVVTYYAYYLFQISKLAQLNQHDISVFVDNRRRNTYLLTTKVEQEVRRGWQC